MTLKPLDIILLGIAALVFGWLLLVMAFPPGLCLEGFEQKSLTRLLPQKLPNGEIIFQPVTITFCTPMKGQEP